MNNYGLNLNFTTLKITFKALSTVKLYFEFSSYLSGFYRINMDDLEVVTLEQNEVTWYEFIPERDYSIKFYRAKGFPLLKVIECEEESKVECLSKHQKKLKL